ncbi:hypothetical protein [Actinoplanes sp. N902-109]|uniref:hypothetical protein n=1 Tax=Actinoplanes sp. (strain N902-109) TaxID=649831 RepID=UPI0012FAEE89|nr:hypothetical protein [Actinoplanes sp. N902-109]
MQDHPNRRAPYGLSVLVAVGWYATVLTAVVVGTLQTSTERSCDDAPSWCFTPEQGIGIGLVVASPFLLVLVLCTLPVAALCTRLVSSAPLAGTLSAVVAGAVVAALAALLLAAR